MKTKNIILNGLLAAAGALLLPGCSLDEYNPSGGPTVEEYCTTPEKFGKLINSCYYPLTRTWTGGAEDQVVFTAEVGTDIWVCPQGTSYNKELFLYQSLGAPTGALKECWQGPYESINYCNAAIYCAPTAGFSDPDERDAKVAEAHFLRAFFNFYLVEQFGGVYLPTTQTTLPMTDIPRSSVAEFYKLIFSDLKFAMKHLPAKQDETGRATKAAAYHLYAKACLQYAGHDEATDKTQLYTEARDTALALINHRADYGIELYPEAAEIFDVSNNKSNKEAIWVATHSANSALNPRGDKYWNRVYKQFGCLGDTRCGVVFDIKTEYVKGDGRIMPSLALLDSYEAKDTRYAAFFREEFYAAEDYTWSESDAKTFEKAPSVKGKVIHQGELALRFTRENMPDRATATYGCLDRNDLFNSENGTVVSKYASIGYPALRKFEAPGMYHGDVKKSYTSADQILFRLAETYLLAAEASFRLDDAAAAATYINVVRNRACENHDGSMNISAGDVTVDFILAERARELCGEYTRWMDLKRMGKTVMERYIMSNPDIKEFGSFDINVHYLRPIPEGVELNYQKDPAKFQNPGY